MTFLLHVLYSALLLEVHPPDNNIKIMETYTKEFICKIYKLE